MGDAPASASASAGRGRAASDAQRVEQVAAEGLVKAAQVVLGARRGRAGSAPAASTSASASINRWFNLETEERDPLLDHWRRDAGAPVVLDTAFQQPGEAPHLLERWVFRYRRKTPGLNDLSSSSSSGSASLGAPGGSRLLQRSGSGRLETPVIYKRLVIMLRSLYSKSRMMPGYALHSALKRRAGAPGLACTLHAPADGAQLADAVPGGMATFDFTPIETPVGFLTFAVHYLPALPAPAALAVRGAPAGQDIPARAAPPSPSLPAAAALGHPKQSPPEPPHAGALRRPSWSPAPQRSASASGSSASERHSPPAQFFLPRSSSPSGRFLERLGSSPLGIPSFPGRTLLKQSPSPGGGARAPPSRGASPVHASSAPGAMPSAPGGGGGGPPSEPGAVITGFDAKNQARYRPAPTQALPVSGLNPVARPGPPGPSGGSSPRSRSSSFQKGAGASGSRSFSKSYGSDASHQPMSISPQLPFAFTPQSRHSPSFLDSDSPPISGRNSRFSPGSPGDALALVPRPTWSPRSSVDTNASSLPQFHGSLSTVIDMKVDPMSIGGGMPHLASPFGPARLTASPHSADDFPFAIDSDSSASSAATGTFSGLSPGPVRPPDEDGPSQGAAIGSLVRLLQDAPPLKPTRAQATVGSALLELKQIAEQAKEASMKAGPALAQITEVA